MTSGYSAEKIARRFGIELPQGETIMYAYTRHWIVFVRPVFFFFVFVIVGVVLAWWAFHPDPYSRPETEFPFLSFVVIYLLGHCGYLLYRYVDWRNDTLIVTDQRLIHIEQTILLIRAQREASLEKVQNVHFIVPSALARLLSYGSVKIETAARGTDLSFGPIPQVQAAYQQIMGEVQKSRKKTSTRLMEQTLLHRLHPDQPKEYPPPQMPLQVEDLSQKIAGRFHLPLVPPNPMVQGDSITWHKHGIFLLLRMLKSLGLLAVLGVGGWILFSIRADALLWVPWAFLLLSGLVYLVANYEAWREDIYVVTLDRLHDINRPFFGLFGEERRSAPLERIQNIFYNKPGLWANLLNYGNVRIQTAGAEDLSFDRVPRPADVQSEIYRRQDLYRLREQQRQREEITDWLLVYRDVDRAFPDS